MIGFANAAANGMMPRTMLISLNDNPMLRACSVLYGHKPDKAGKIKVELEFPYLAPMLVLSYISRLSPYQCIIK